MKIIGLLEVNGTNMNVKVTYKEISYKLIYKTICAKQVKEIKDRSVEQKNGLKYGLLMGGQKSSIESKNIYGNKRVNVGVKTINGWTIGMMGERKTKKAIKFLIEKLGGRVGRIIKKRGIDYIVWLRYSGEIKNIGAFIRGFRGSGVRIGGVVGVGERKTGDGGRAKKRKRR
jgi:hypothetical protein